MAPLSQAIAGTSPRTIGSTPRRPFKSLTSRNGRKSHPYNVSGGGDRRAQRRSYPSAAARMSSSAWLRPTRTSASTRMAKSRP